MIKQPESQEFLLINRQTIADSISFEDYVEAVELAFKMYSEGAIHVPEVVHIPAKNGGFHIKSAIFTHEPNLVAIKINGNFPNNPESENLPTIQGIIILSDGTNGTPLALFDSSEITAQRTAAATSLAVRYLANPDSSIATIIGCGIQGRVQLSALIHALSLEKVYVYDIDEIRCQNFALEMSSIYQLPIIPINNFETGTRQSHVIVTCTTSQQSFLYREHVRLGAFIAAVGADNGVKQELDTALMDDTKVVVDILEQCAEIGELKHALASNTISKNNVCATISDAIKGNKTIRTSKDDIVIFDSTGSAIQDLTVAALIYDRACKKRLGMTVEFPN